MKALENLVQIDAPPSIVWRVTEEIVNWPQWTPTVESVERIDTGAWGVGSVARLKQPGLPAANWVVTEWNRGARFAWESRNLGLRMTAIHELTATGAGTTNLLRLELSGVVASLLWPIIRSSAERALATENAGLKRFCEARNLSD